MIDYQPSHGMRHCMCSNVSDGFTYSTTAETYVHAACGKPRPTVQTNLHQLPAPVDQTVLKSAQHLAEQLISGNPVVQSALTGNTYMAVEQAEAIAEGSPANEDPSTWGAEPIEQPPTEQPKRRRGRPPKDTKGYALERRDAPDRWCVIREATGEIVTSGLTSKAKATEAMDELIRKATDDGDSPAGVAQPPTQPGTDAPGTEPAAPSGPAADHVPAGPEQPVGSAAGGVRPAAPGGHPEDQATGRHQGLDQGGAEPTVPGAGGHGDQPEPHGPAEVLPAGQGEGGPEDHREGLPGGLGPVHVGGNQLDPRQAVTASVVCTCPRCTDGSPNGNVACMAPGGAERDHAERMGWQPTPDYRLVVSPGDMEALESQGWPTTGLTVSEPVPWQPTPVAAIHGPQGDCPECWARNDWCPESLGGNSYGPDASVPTSGQGSMPASAALPGTQPSTGLSTSVGSSPVLVVPGPDSPPNNLPGTVIDSSRPSLAAFMSAAKHVAQSGNTPWAAQYANELRQIVIDRANNAPRNLQRHLGPSEIGVPCDRQVVGKLAGFERTNHVTDPWPSIMGTAGHAWMEETFRSHNDTLGWQRWLVEQRVTPHPDHAGTSDLYDAATFSVVDWKFLGETSMNQLRSPDGPGPQYFYQLLTYRRGYQLMGYRVDRIVIVGWPRTGSSADGMYAWEHVCTPEDDVKLDTLFARMEWRKQWAAAITAGNARLSDVPAVPNDHDCYLCPFYRPQSARDGGPGCPGHVGT